MSTHPQPPQDVPHCPRHPDRVSYVRCQRCGRPACPECQRPAAVGVHCVDCVREAQAGVRQVRTASGVVVRARKPVVTYAIMALCVVGYLMQLFVPGFSQAFVEWNLAVGHEPWRMLTAGFLHDTSNPLPVHLALNMLSLWFLGRALEPVLGHWRFAAVFCLGVIGGSVAQVLLSDPTTSGWGASGGIFAIGAALLVELRHDRQSLISMAVVLGINLVYGFTIGANISWQAHVGGLVTGLILGGIYASGTKVKNREAYHVACTVLVGILLVWLGMYLGFQAWDAYVGMAYAS